MRTPVLVGIDAQTTGMVIAVGGPLSIGRDEDAAVCVPFEGVSRRHAELSLASDGVRLRDLGSTNGTAVNGAEVTEIVLAPGDRIQLGSVEFEYRIETRTGLIELRDRAVARKRVAQLSPREREVALAIARGLKSAEIAKQLHISTRTVNTHLEHIYERLELRTRTALAGLVARAGLQ
jgi:pSer/pThr/pTyr-binding forkhead associated (FHA) protein